ncbi:MAG: transglutaminase-like cysteine peptidase [Sphingomicrobium sp.]
MGTCFLDRPTWRRTALAGALVAAPTLAQAAVPAPAASFTASSAKAEAILGAPSRLAAILAQQEGLPAPRPFQPAAVVRTANWAVASGNSGFGHHVSTGRPDVFGSIALAVRHTPLDRQWRRVARHRVDGSAAMFATALRKRAELDRIEAVNHFVNDRVKFVDDASQYGREDLWVAASDTLRRRRGDCEDYAIAKLQMLRAAGVADRDLYLVIARDLIRRADHALLVVRVGERMVVLDNGTDQLLDADDASDYRPVLTFSTNGAWTHGYRVALEPQIMAAATLAPLSPSRPARAD